jgi:hypothetical protein
MHLSLRRPSASTPTHLWSFWEAQAASGDTVCQFSLSSRTFPFLTQYPVIQLAKYSGFYPIITTSSLKHADELKSLGATHVIDRNTSVVAEVRKLTDKPILTVYDAISSTDTQQAGIDVLAAGGKLVIVLPPSVKAEGKEIIHIMGLASLHPELLTSLYGKDVYGFLEQGVLKVCLQPRWFWDNEWLTMFYLSPAT